MSPRPVLRALVALPLLAGTLGAQPDSTVRTPPAAVAPQPAGAVRPTPPTDSVVTAPAIHRVSSVDPILTTLAATLVGAAAGAIFDEGCFGGAGGMAARGAVAGAAISIPAYFLTLHEETPRDRQHRDGWFDRIPNVAKAVVVSAVAGAALGAPIGAVEGARRPDACGGGAGAGALRGAGHIAAGTLAVSSVGLVFEALGSGGKR